ncbi:MAG: YitT family protein [Thermotogae bacterium]|nr:YitT family protein [Thermotogota bacterium]RKX53162.1 MAG: YitT family protein [Thermotoga sp.]
MSFQKLKRGFKDYLFITLGSLITALGLDFFLIPNKIVAGGVSGLATILFYLFHLPVGLQMLAYNVILFTLAFKLLGVHFGLKSIYTSVILSIFVDMVMALNPPIPDLSKDPLLAPIYGGIITGIGMGVVFWRGASTGGTDIIAMIMNKYLGITSGSGLLISDSLITLFAVFAFGPIKAMYGILAIITTSKTIDTILEGIESTRSVLIITEKLDEMKNMILKELGRGATIISAMGAYSGIERPILMSVVRRRELAILRRRIYDIDPKAFIIIHSNSEVIGEGFKKLDIK